MSAAYLVVGQWFWLWSTALVEEVTENIEQEEYGKQVQECEKSLKIQKSCQYKKLHLYIKSLKTNHTFIWVTIYILIIFVSNISYLYSRDDFSQEGGCTLHKIIINLPWTHENHIGSAIVRSFSTHTQTHSDPVTLL